MKAWMKTGHRVGLGWGQSQARRYVVKQKHGRVIP